MRVLQERVDNVIAVTDYRLHAPPRRVKTHRSTWRRV